MAGALPSRYVPVGTRESGLCVPCGHQGCSSSYRHTWCGHWFAVDWVFEEWVAPELAVVAFRKALESYGLEGRFQGTLEGAVFRFLFCLDEKKASVPIGVVRECLIASVRLSVASRRGCVAVAPSERGGVHRFACCRRWLKDVGRPYLCSVDGPSRGRPALGDGALVDWCIARLDYNARSQ